MTHTLSPPADQTPTLEDALRAFEFLDLKAQPPTSKTARAPLLPGRVIRVLANKLAIHERNVLALLKIPEQAFQRRQAAHGSLTEVESGRVLRIARIAGLARHVFESDAKATRWLSSRHLILGGRPIDMLVSDAGAREVEDELWRIEWCDFA
ncbi:antitoxin Xre/MbcA/ParS toxin-binding domain-containing protein [Pseudoxanthomonas indica]|uniref:Putative toxin-antitoxin system antitoxin component, TIGR02293 family n=1 Tax=Pseudoxanthomonas indica TaxID=428993 RepID=A0A1T5LE77_9GAMM|nr:antitoxin Xre/MbcA/ParS toxin-binding domain-containing protein [Pseudoxanthomonas indica]GGD33880.1 hypothetical protein GCM10007235_02160 [Pseudoxanthomonas indica]SKC73939.1 putative toxin-antitoxin system antitoxin component, TIGR02293 family [Pseudoxanthomonas indica]